MEKKLKENELVDEDFEIDFIPLKWNDKTIENETLLSAFQDESLHFSISIPWALTFRYQTETTKIKVTNGEYKLVSYVAQTPWSDINLEEIDCYLGIVLILIFLILI